MRKLATLPSISLPDRLIAMEAASSSPVAAAASVSGTATRVSMLLAGEVTREVTGAITLPARSRAPDTSKVTEASSTSASTSR